MFEYLVTLGLMNQIHSLDFTCYIKYYQILDGKKRITNQNKFDEYVGNSWIYKRNGICTLYSPLRVSSDSKMKDT